MAKKTRSSIPKKPAGKTVKKAAKAAVKAVAKPKSAPARKLTKKVPKKTVNKAVKKQVATKRAAAAPVVSSAAVKAARQAEVKQAAQFDKGARLFHSRKFGQARPILGKVVAGPNVGLSHRAGIYLRICEEQTARSKPRLKTVEENYNYAVQLINDRQLAEAERYLKKALRMDRKAAHAHYALSVVKVLNGDVSGGFESLRSSIQMDPQNRILALRDPDFAAVAREEPFKSLLAE